MMQDIVDDKQPQPIAIGRSLQALLIDNPEYATQFVDLLLEAACRWRVSDVHLQPAADGLQVRWRVDGVLQDVGTFPRATTTSVVSRLKVLAGLLTYHTDVPQEGRLREGVSDVEMRVSTFPTMYGERAVVRLFGGSGQFQHLDDLGLPDEIRVGLERLLHETSGMILVTGPAGSGKTTTLYACLRGIIRASGGGRSVVTLEDPAESALDGVAQSQINPAAGFDFATGLRSLMRQDPEVIMVGEIRDTETAEVAFQAALTGQLVLSSFHTGSAAGAVTRLSDLGIAPYMLRSGLRAIICQRLVRRLCDCAVESRHEQDRLGFAVDVVRKPLGCEACGPTGYRGRLVLSEMLTTDDRDLQQAILSRADTSRLENLAIAAGMCNVWRRACQAVDAGQTSPAEVRRVLGFASDSPTQD